MERIPLKDKVGMVFVATYDGGKEISGIVARVSKRKYVLESTDVSVPATDYVPDVFDSIIFEPSDSMYSSVNDCHVEPKDVKNEFQLNDEPLSEWIKKHPQLSEVSYIPISIVEDLSDSIFGITETYIDRVDIMMGNVVVQLRVVANGKTKSGVGAALIENPKDAFELQKKLPLARAMAYKDAMRQFGKVFGRDINRDPIEFVKQNDAHVETLN